MSRIPVQGLPLCVVPVHDLEQEHSSKFLVFVSQNEKIKRQIILMFNHMSEFSSFCNDIN